MPRLDAQNLAIAVVILTFGGVAWVFSTASQSDRKLILTDAANLTKQGPEEFAKPVVIESQGFESVDEADSENTVTVVAVHSAKATGRKSLPAARASRRSQTGTIRGRIVFDGTPPAHELMIKGLPKVDPAVCGQTEHYYEDMLVNPLNNGIKNVFVYLISRPEALPDSSVKISPAKLTIRGCRFEPRCLAVQTGQKIQIHYDDPIPHNLDMKPASNSVWSRSPAWYGQVREFYFKNTEAMPFFTTCAIHPWMRTWILVSNHPFAAITDENGKFEMPNLPYGKHRFRIFHERSGLLARVFELTVSTEESTLPELSYDVSQFGDR